MRQVKPVLTGYYTLQEAAKALGCSQRTAWRYVTEGRLQGVLVQGMYFVPQHALEKFKRPQWGNPGLGKIVKERWRQARLLAAAKEKERSLKKKRRIFPRWS